MGVVGSNKTLNKGKHTFLVPSGSTGEFVFQVSPGRKISVAVDNPNGDSFDLIHYNFTAEEATTNGISRVKGIDVAAITDVNYTKASVTGMVEVGIDLGAVASTSDIILEALESKLG